MRLVSQLFCAAFVLVASAQVLQAQPSHTPDWADDVDALMVAEMARAKIPGAQIAIVENGRLVYAKGYGVANVETGKAVSEQTLFQTGSVTKAITAAVLAQLAAEGTVDLQAPISQYVPELAGHRVGAVTTHQLLSHSAGWADSMQPYGRADDAALGDSMRALSDAMVLTEPDRVFSYSNPGFAMAGYVAERAAKTPFVTLADRLVLRKFGMSHATFRPMVAMTYDFSQGHVDGPSGVTEVLRPMPGNAAEYPAGFLYASASDLARLGVALMAGGMLDGERVMPVDAVRLMTTGYVKIPGSPNNRSGYGLQIDSVDGQRVWRKSGAVDGFSSELSMWPDQNFAVAISVNRQNEMPTRGTVLVGRIIGVVATEVKPAPVIRTRAATATERKQLIGRYRFGTDGTIEIAEVNDELVWRGARGVFPVQVVDADRIATMPPGEPPRVFTLLRDPDGELRFLHSRSRAFVKQH